MKRYRMRRMGVDDCLQIGACAQHFGVDEDFVVARHRAADLLTFEVDSDDVVGGHLFETDGGGLHQKPAGIVRQPTVTCPATKSP